MREDKLGKDKLGKDKLGKGDLAKGKDKAGELEKFAKGKTMPDKRAATKIRASENPGGPRQDPPRSSPRHQCRAGAPAAASVPRHRRLHRRSAAHDETRYVSTEMVFHVGPNVSRQAVDAAGQAGSA